MAGYVKHLIRKKKTYFIYDILIENIWRITILIGTLFDNTIPYNFLLSKSLIKPNN